MSAALENIPRDRKAVISGRICDNLKKRNAEGPPEPGFDDFIPEVSDVTALVGKHVKGKVGAIAAHVANLARSDKADIQVDTCMRHIESFLYIEAHRRAGPHVEDVLLLHRALFPQGLGFLDDRVEDENPACRRILSILRADEHKATLAAILFPMAWLDLLDVALAESDAAINDVIEAREEKSGHVDRGRDAEAQWVDVMKRLRKYVDVRAKAGETEKKREGREIIAPLLEALAQMRAEAAARKTRRANQEPGSDAKTTKRTTRRAKKALNPPPEPAPSPASPTPAEPTPPTGS
jgi:hypothetical protein